MRTSLGRHKSWLAGPWLHPIVLLLVAVLAYAPLIPWLGFYWDDWPKAWFLHTLGPAGFDAVYAVDRPYLAWTYLLTTSIVGETPAYWQVFGLFSRWLTGVALWWMLKQVWPRRAEVAVLTSLIFLVFPGFSLQSISLIFSHYLFIQAIHLFALGLMVKAIRELRHRIRWTLLSIAGSLYSLFSLEYYVGLELLRPLLIFWTAGKDAEDAKSRVKLTLRFWLPYIPILPLFLIWRIRVIGYPTYQPRLLDRMLERPVLQSAEEIGPLIAHDLLEVTVGSWLRLVPLPELESFGLISLGLFVAVVSAVWVLLGIYLYRRQRAGEASAAGRTGNVATAVAVFVTGVWLLVAAGWPFWLSDLPLRLSFPNDRFVLAFMLGGSLVVVAFLLALGISMRMRLVAVALVAIFVGLGAGQQVRYATEFRRDWDAQNNLLWQFIWRVPDLEEGTTILTNELPLEFDDDESVTGAINWIYGKEEASGSMPYLVADLKLRLGKSFVSLDEDVPIRKPYRATSFEGSTSQVIVMAFDPPKCLRMLDVVLHDSLPGIPNPLPSAIPLSKIELILGEPLKAVEPPTNVLGPEPPHRWCYYFQKADLARQLGDWEEIASLGDVAFSLSDRPNDASERLPFIEGYAHVGRWEEATRLSLEIVEEQPPMWITVCRTWMRLESATKGGDKREMAIAGINDGLRCHKMRDSGATDSN